MLTSESLKSQISLALPRHMTPDRMMRIALTELRKNPKLAECDPITVVGAVVQSAQLGLELGSGLGHAYLVPFWNNKRRCFECQLIPGYKGFIDLARRSGQIASISARVVYEGDEFRYAYGLDETIEHVPAAKRPSDARITHAYAVAVLKDGAKQMEVMTADEIERVRQMSKQPDGVWKEFPAEMARKTAIRRIAKYLPLSPELVRFTEIDNDSYEGTSQNLHALIDASYEPLPANEPTSIAAINADATTQRLASEKDRLLSVVTAKVNEKVAAGENEVALAKRLGIASIDDLKSRDEKQLVGIYELLK